MTQLLTAAKACPVGNADVIIEAMCAKYVECTPAMTLEQCKTQFASGAGDTSALNCLCAGGVTKIQTCMKNATCGDDQAMSNCLEEAMGGGGSGGSTDGGV